MNSMIAKAVEICAQRGLPYIAYTVSGGGVIMVSFKKATVSKRLKYRIL